MPDLLVRHPTAGGEELRACHAVLGHVSGTPTDEVVGHTGTQAVIAVLGSLHASYRV